MGWLKRRIERVVRQMSDTIEIRTVEPVLIDCAACKGGGRAAQVLRGEAELEVRGAAVAREMCLLMQGVCLGCRGSGKQFVPLDLENRRDAK